MHPQKLRYRFSFLVTLPSSSLPHVTPTVLHNSLASPFPGYPQCQQPGKEDGVPVCGGKETILKSPEPRKGGGAFENLLVGHLRGERSVCLCVFVVASAGVVYLKEGCLTSHSGAPGIQSLIRVLSFNAAQQHKDCHCSLLGRHFVHLLQPRENRAANVEKGSERFPKRFPFLQLLGVFTAASRFLFLSPLQEEVKISCFRPTSGTASPSPRHFSDDTGSGLC